MEYSVLPNEKFDVGESYALPADFAARLRGKSYAVDGIGLSGSTVLTFEDCVLKIDAHTPAVDASVDVMRWMAKQLPVPEVIGYEVMEGKGYLLMSRMPGKMSCDEYYMERSAETVRLLADGLRQLWSVDIAGCPRSCTLEDDLARAKQTVMENKVDAESFRADAPDFESPETLLTWLEGHKPIYDPVLSHGDYCMPNILLENGRVSGLIDLAHAGIADRYSDIRDCYWSLTANFNGTFGGKVYTDFNPNMLFDFLQINPDWDKLKYFMLLNVLLG